MADEHYKWLGRDAAERLLSGEPLEAVDDDTRGAADRLAEALSALASEVQPSDAELPGEEAALAAYRKARSGKNGEAAALAGRTRTQAASHSADAGLVRLGRPGPEGRRAPWGRPMRFGMVAALAAGMLGGVAVAAGTGVLPTPFRDDSPEPAASVSAGVTPERPLMSPSPADTPGGSPGEPKPDDTAGGPSGDDTAQGGDAATGQPGSGKSGKEQGKSREWWRGVVSACRDVSNGKDLDGDRRRSLENAAGGKSKVQKYCNGVLSDHGDHAGEGSSGHAPGASDDNDTGSDRSKAGKDKGGKGHGGDEGSGKPPGGGNAHHGNGGLMTPASSPHASGPRSPEPAASPTPPYSALGSPGAA